MGNCSWAGMTDFVSCSYTCSHGITPGVAQLVLPLSQDGKLKTYGNLVIRDDTDANPFVILFDCKISDFQATRVGDGRGFIASILDRRWKWAFPTIDGNYNIRDEKGLIKDWSRKSLSELIDLCLQAMDEIGYAIKLPDVEAEYLDEVNWSDTNAAQALAELVERHGGVVIYQPDYFGGNVGDKVIIAKAGEGDPLPKLNYSDFMPAQDLPEGPKSISVTTAPICYQVAIPLEAVGFEPGGEIVPIDDLSYKPTAGWSADGRPPLFRNISLPAQPPVGLLPVPGLFVAPLTRSEYTKLAKECVYRTYRPKIDANGVPLGPDGTPLQVPGYGPIQRVEQLVLLNGIVTKDPGPDGKPIVEPAKVYGIFHRGESAYTTPTEPALYEGGFTIDANKSLVRFAQYMYRLNPSAVILPPVMLSLSLSLGVDPWGIAPAELVLICSVHVRDPKNHQVERHFLQRVINPNANTKPMVSQHGDIQAVFQAEYDPANKFALKGQSNNLDDVRDAERYYLDILQAQFETKVSEEREYPGIVGIELDGSRRQVTWSVGGGVPCTTRASRNTEHAFWLPTYQQRRGREKLKLFFDIAQPTRQPFNPLFGG